MRAELDDVLVAIDGHAERSSTTVEAAGAYVLVVSTTLPDLAVGLTSSYLSRLEGATAVSHLHLGPSRQERFAQRVLEAGLHSSVAGACLLDHAAELQQALADHTRTRVAVDVGVRALRRAAEIWGPAAPDT